MVSAPDEQDEIASYDRNFLNLIVTFSAWVRNLFSIAWGNFSYRSCSCHGTNERWPESWSKATHVIYPILYQEFRDDLPRFFLHILSLPSKKCLYTRFHRWPHFQCSPLELSSSSRIFLILFQKWTAWFNVPTFPPFNGYITHQKPHSKSKSFSKDFTNLFIFNKFKPKSKTFFHFKYTKW